MIFISPNLDQVGINSFISALHVFGLKPCLISGIAVKNKFTHSKFKRNYDSLPELVLKPKTLANGSILLRVKKRSVAKKGKKLKHKYYRPPGIC